MDDTTRPTDPSATGSPAPGQGSPAGGFATPGAPGAQGPQGSNDPYRASWGAAPGWGAPAGGYGAPQANGQPAQPGGYRPPAGAPGYQPGYQPNAAGAWAAQQPQPQQPSAAAAPKRGHGWIVGIVAILAVVAVVIFGMASCTSAFTAPFSALSFEETSEADSLTSDAVAVITLSGTIQYDGTECSPEGLKSLLDEAEANDRIKAVVLRVDSGGGTATAGEEMAGYVADFSKPIVVSSASTNASAAYEISSQADYIFTGKSTMIGSIGTAIEFMDYSGLMELLGIDSETIASSGSKDSTYGYRPLTDEERAHYQDMVNQINEEFIKTVAEGRGMTVDEVRALATGLTFTGMDAVENGLADEIGTLEDAAAYAAELAGMGSYAVIDLAAPSSGIDLLSLLAAGAAQGSAAQGSAAEGSAIDVIQ